MTPPHPTREEKKEDGITFKVNGVWTIYPDGTAHALYPRWWHRLMFWKKWNYGEWKIKQEYKKLSEMLDETAGLPIKQKKK